MLPPTSTNITEAKNVLSHAGPEKVIHAFISARLDYWKSLYKGPIPSIARSELGCLAFDNLTKVWQKRQEHTTSILATLPWLPTRVLRQACQQPERRWKNKLRVSDETLQHHLSVHQRAVKCDTSNLVSNNCHRPVVLFNVFNTLRNPRNSVHIIPTLDLCDSFLKFFVEILWSSVTTPSDRDPSVLAIWSWISLSPFQSPYLRWFIICGSQIVLVMPKGHQNKDESKLPQPKRGRGHNVLTPWTALCRYSRPFSF